MPMIPESGFYLMDQPGGYGNAPDYVGGDPGVQKYLVEHPAYAASMGVKIMAQGIRTANGVLWSWAEDGKQGAYLAGYAGFPSVDEYIAQHPDPVSTPASPALAAVTQATQKVADAVDAHPAVSFGALGLAFVLAIGYALTRRR